MTEGKNAQLKISLSTGGDGNRKFSQQIKSTIADAVKSGLKEGFGDLSKELSKTLASAITAAVKAGLEGSTEAAKKHAKTVADATVAEGKRAQKELNEEAKKYNVPVRRAYALQQTTGGRISFAQAESQLAISPPRQQELLLLTLKDQAKKNAAQQLERSNAALAEANAARAKLDESVGTADRRQRRAVQWSAPKDLDQAFASGAPRVDYTKDDRLWQRQLPGQPTAKQYAKDAAYDPMRYQVSALDEPIPENPLSTEYVGRSAKYLKLGRRVRDKEERDREKAKAKAEKKAEADRVKAERLAEAQQEAAEKAKRDAAKAEEQFELKLRRQAWSLSRMEDISVDSATSVLRDRSDLERLNILEGARPSRRPGGGGGGGISAARILRGVFGAGSVTASMRSGDALTGGIGGALGAGYMAAGAGLGAAVGAGALALIPAAYGAYMYGGYSGAVSAMDRAKGHVMDVRDQVGLAAASRLFQQGGADSVQRGIFGQANTLGRNFGLTSAETIAMMGQVAHARGGFTGTAGMDAAQARAAAAMKQGVSVGTSGMFERAAFRGGLLDPNYNYALMPRMYGFQGAEIGQFADVQAQLLQSAIGRGTAFNAGGFAGTVGAFGQAVGLPQATRMAGSLEDMVQRTKTAGIFGSDNPAMTLMMAQAFGGYDVNAPGDRLENINRGIQNMQLTPENFKKLGGYLERAGGSRAAAVAIAQSMFGGDAATIQSLFEGKPSSLYGTERQQDLMRGVPDLGATSREWGFADYMNAAGIGAATRSSEVKDITEAEARNLQTGVDGLKGLTALDNQASKIAENFKSLAELMNDFRFALNRTMSLGQW